MSDFDARARSWDGDASKGERARHIAAAIAARVPLGGKTVLEYGAGTGLLGLALQPLVAHVTLADSSREMLAVAREKIAASGVPNVATLALDLASERAPPELRFDVVCTLMTLHHIADIDGILRSFHGLLRSGGALCIADLDAEDGSFHGPGFAGHAGFDRADLRARMERSGFRDVRIATAHQVTRETAAGSRVFPVFLAVGEKG